VPLVSVVVPVRNGERHLRESLGSISRQTLADLEIIVVDDGSTDRTPEILGELAAADPRIRVIPGPATGSAGAARNAGLAVARGDYLAFLDADDFFAPRLLEKLHGKASTDKADVAVTRFRVLDERTGERVSVDWGLRTKYLPARTPFPPEQLGAALFYAVSPVVWNKLFRAAFVRGLDLQFQPLRRTNDVFFTFSAIARATRITYVDEFLIDYRIGNASSLQGSLHEAPLEFADSLTALQAGLKDSGRYPDLEQAFVNEAVEICLTNLGKASTFTAFQQVHAALRSELLERFGALGRQADYFVTPELAAQLAQLVDTTAEEYLFARQTAAGARAVKAQADALTARREADQRAAASRPAQRAPVPERRAAPQPTGTPTEGRADVSVIVPVYNAALFLTDCITSIQRQTGVTLEILCIDDGSTDSSQDVLEQLARSDPRLTVTRQENAGPSVARNRGLEQATGRYVCFVDSDDYWNADALADLVRQADEAEVDAILFDGVTVREPGISDKTWASFEGYYRRSGVYDSVDTGPELLARMKLAGEYRVQPCLYLLRQEFVQHHHLRFLPGLTREDNLFTFEMMLRADRATHTPMPLYTRRLREGSLMTAGSRASAARGYFVSFYEMLRLVSGQHYGDQVGPQVGAVLHKAFKQAKLHFVKLDPDLGDRLADIDPEPDAQAIFLILKQARDEAQRAKRAKPPSPTSPTGLTPLRRARLLAGRGYRFLRRLVRRT